jgi:hypothetical protein
VHKSSVDHANGCRGRPRAVRSLSVRRRHRHARFCFASPHQLATYNILPVHHHFTRPGCSHPPSSPTPARIDPPSRVPSAHQAAPPWTPRCCSPPTPPSPPGAALLRPRDARGGLRRAGARRPAGPYAHAPPQRPRQPPEASMG